MMLTYIFIPPDTVHISGDVKGDKQHCIRCGCILTDGEGTEYLPVGCLCINPQKCVRSKE